MVCSGVENGKGVEGLLHHETTRDNLKKLQVVMSIPERLRIDQLVLVQKMILSSAVRTQPKGSVPTSAEIIPLLPVVE